MYRYEDPPYKLYSQNNFNITFKVAVSMLRMIHIHIVIRLVFRCLSPTMKPKLIAFLIGKSILSGSYCQKRRIEVEGGGLSKAILV